MRLLKKLRSRLAFSAMKFSYIPVEDISCERFTPENVRELERFRASVAKLGVIVPLTVVRRKGQFEVVSGARRLAAARACGLERVPCVVIRASEAELNMIKLADNNHRRDPNFAVTADELRALVYSHGCSIGEAAEIAGLDFDEAANILRTLRLGDDMLGAMMKAGLSQKHALALLRLGDDRIRESALIEMAYRQISPDAADAYIDALLRHGEKPAPRQKNPIYVMKDVRIFLNSIEHGLEIMRAAGIEARSETKTGAREITLTVKIPCTKEELSAG